MVVFLDTYALIEIDMANPRYGQYAGMGGQVITSMFNLVELHFVYLKQAGEKEAEGVLQAFRDHVVPLNDEIIRQANRFKLAHIKKRLSYADCIGYAAAQYFEVPFVTGDYAFKGLPDVEFIQ
ncbi:MAG TPA: PIN domain-containing protein [Candidatus Nanoarchaeia archaeon]|nr:PIN domain-containing protein [Candidatus Nanoarchaeia archaeon]